MRTNNTRDVLVGVAVFILIILLAIFLIKRHNDSVTTVTNIPFPTPVSQLQQTLQNNFGIIVPDSAIKADLKDVTGSNQIGLATLDKSNNQNNYTVIANLETPPAGFFYQAWLIKDNNPVSLGRLTIAKGGWIVNFNSSSDLSDHKTIWITLERYSDNTPEKHILEGSF